MQFINTAIVKFSVFLTLGILTGHYFSSPNTWVVFAIPILFIVLFFFWWIARRQLIQHIYFGIFSYACFFGIGYFHYHLRLPEFQPKHFSQHLIENASRSSEASSTLLQLKIIETLKPNRYSQKYIAQVIVTNKQSTQGKVLLSIKQDTVPYLLLADAIILVPVKVKALTKPLNPFQFNYGAYLRTLGISHQVSIESASILKQRKGSFSLRGQASKFRLYLIKQLKKTPISEDARGILQALVLGEKSDISEDLRSDYAAAGAIHILAVSGLHVGILYAILFFISNPLRRIRFGKGVQISVIILCLWGFAFITGLSPSVTRAVTMFTFFALAKTLDRPTQTINTLFLSYFVLLAINPLWLFQVGFQLSYLAVLFIVLVHPLLKRFYQPRFYLDRLLWNIFTVSIAAQLGVLPLTLYYFHQFPSLFFITSLVILPFLGFILCFGIIVVVLAAFELLFEKLAIWYSTLIEYMNKVISIIAHQEHFIFTDISFPGTYVIAFYLLITSLIAIGYRITYYRIQLCLFSTIIVLGVLIFEKYSSASNSLIIFHKHAKTLIAYKSGDKLKVFSSDTMLQKNLNPVKDYRIEAFISRYSEEPLPKQFQYNNMHVQVIDSTGIYLKRIKNSIVLLIDSPKIHLERLIDSLQPKFIIADGSNYNSYVNRWRNTCNIKKLPFYHTGSKGAFIAE
ncbi:ComEC/Rec2 family competence protein [Cochleicola gelatinilyticus]|nr:ComEC/Rec2 family competence protein [Cochleicola gelatinilyticus]